MSRTCLSCHLPMEATSLPELSGADGDVKVLLNAMPALICPQGHKRFTRSGFPAALMEALVTAAEAEMKPCAETGLIFKHSVCTACGEPLPKAGEIQRSSVRVELKGEMPIDVEVAAPMTTCSKCGAKQLQSAHALERSIPAALVRAFESTAVQPG